MIDRSDFRYNSDVLYDAIDYSKANINSVADFTNPINDKLN